MDIDSDTKPSPSTLKTPVVRGARACTVCRNAKMKCVGADDGDKPCQRCKRAGVPCVFEKHRRGRKPGSKLSEASKMLRRLEKGLNTAKLKSQSAEASPASPYPPSDLRPPSESYSTTLRSAEPSYAQPPQPTSPHYAQPPPQQLPPPPQPAPPPPAASAYQNGDSPYASAFQGNRNDANPEDEDDDDIDRTESIYPAKFIQNQRNSFFRTILNPHDAPAQESNANNQKASSSSPPSSSSLIPQPRPPGPLDPVAAGILHETDTKVLFDQLFLRLNPFINLFDPALHTAPYVRSKCPFLFTTLLMVSCRFWRPAVFKQCQKLAHEFSVLAFAEAWKRIEVVQAFACLTYWKDPDDNRTWTYIGYACRMAVELGLNRYVAHPPVHETELQRLERRNRERTYLVLFIHDRSLSTQTGRHWMLPEGDLVKHSATWHLGGIKGIVRPEDVIISAFVQLRLIAAETTDVFSAATKGNSDINYDVVLRNTNAKLTEWDEKWRSEMTKAKGEGFHLSFLSFFRLYVRLFLNSFGIQATLLPGSRVAPSIQALSTCWKSALDSLQILSDDFVKMSMLCYCQDSILVMSAYSAVFLLKLLSTQSIYQHLGESTANEIYRLIEKAGKAYVGAGSISKATISTEYHGGFLQSLLSNDIFRHRQPQAKQEETDIPVDPRMQNQVQQNPGPVQASPVQPSYPQQVAARPQEQLNYSYANPVPTHQSQSIQHNYHNAYAMQQQRQQQAMEHQQNYGYDPTLPSAPHNATELEANYWKNMFIELGFGQTNDGPPTNVLAVSNTSDVRCMPPAPEYIENHHAAQHQLVMQQHHHHQQQQQQAHMYHMHHHQQVAVHQGYGH